MSLKQDVVLLKYILTHPACINKKTHLTKLTFPLEFIEYREISVPQSVGGNRAVITVLFIIMAAPGLNHSKQQHETLKTLLDYEDQCTVV